MSQTVAAGKIGNLAEQTIGLSTGELMPAENNTGVFTWLVQVNETLPPWWSKARDLELGRAWKQSNHLSLAVYNAVAKIAGIPPVVKAKNASNPDHIREAALIQERMIFASEFMRGWDSAYSKFLIDILTQDNGGFLEIIGNGAADGPILGLPIGIRHLDSFRCTRTSDPMYPVIYQDYTGKLYKLHWTRVVSISQLPSPREEMNNVGFCSVSRCFDVASTLQDMVIYKQEKLGSRPPSQMIVGKGITGRTIMSAIRQIEDDQNSRGFRRYSRTVAIGSENPDIDVELINLAHDDHFNEQEGVTLGMYAIASAFGMDADEIWPVATSGGSQGDANLRRMRSRGRLPEQLTAAVARELSFKFLPPYLEIEFDFHDDEQDQQKAIIRDIRGRNRERDLGTGSINTRTARKWMLEDGDVDPTTFDEMELWDGRLPDGRTIAALLYDPHPVYQELLYFGEDPLSIQEKIFDSNTGTVNEVKVHEWLVKIERKRGPVLQRMSETTSHNELQRIHRAWAALDWLEEQYKFAAGRGLPAIPTQHRRLRTDIRVLPDERSPVEEEVSPAQSAQSPGMSENLSGDRASGSGV